jgi:Polyketide cyclase / dehydrase and lipid transport
MKLKFTFLLDASPEKVWNAIADWRAQGEWMLATRVDVVDDRAGAAGAGGAGGAGGVGTKIAAFTGLVPSRGWLGIWDLMEVTSWEPPRRCEVLHYGRWLRGVGLFELKPAGPDQTLFIWSEELTGALATLMKPGLAVGVWLSLRRFARQVRNRRS